MTLNAFAAHALRRHIAAFQMCRLAIDRSPEIASWLVWSMRASDDAVTHKQQFNRARRVLQRAGRRSV